MSNTFFVEVARYLMLVPAIKNKDYCLIYSHETPRDSDIVLAINSDTDATIKKFKKTQQGVNANPSNTEFDTIFIEAKVAQKWFFYKIIESRHKF